MLARISFVSATVAQLCSTLGKLLFSHPATLPCSSSPCDFLQRLGAHYKDLAEEDEFARISAKRHSPLFMWIHCEELAHEEITMEYLILWFSKITSRASQSP